MISLRSHTLPWRINQTISITCLLCLLHSGVCYYYVATEQYIGGMGIPPCAFHSVTGRVFSAKFRRYGRFTNTSLSLSLSLSFYLSLSLYVYFDVSRIRFLWTMQRRKFNRTEAFRARNEISRLMDFERLIRWLKVNSREWILWQVHGELPTLKLRIISVQINVNRESNRAVLD